MKGDFIMSFSINAGNRFSKLRLRVIVTILLQLSLVCGCKGPHQTESLTTTTMSLASPYDLGVGTICFGTKPKVVIDPLNSFFVPGVTNCPKIISENVLGDADSVQGKSARLDAAVEILRSLGLSAEIKGGGYLNARTKAQSLTQRDFIWGNFERAVNAGCIRESVLEHLRATNAVITVSDIVVSGLTVEIATTNLSLASVGILRERLPGNQKRELKAGIVAEFDSNGVFRFSSTSNVVTSIEPIGSAEISKILSNLDIPDRSRTTNCARQVANLTQEVADLKAKIVVAQTLLNEMEKLKGENAALVEWKRKAASVINKPMVKDWNKHGGRRVADADKNRLKVQLNELNPGNPEMLDRNAQVINRIFDFDED